ncbi:uncharacterized protein FA14DRAFT_161261 [Meira miltonrushii]|uniref:Mediator of RNA polymerase II transcription subunit 12 n=1 Tax=Meira miltonrushii TaxID=1280837 RepID=A0A316V7F0_9BASI|nr:uncharacterized protein FA14DRAFT_161261 [Meira miltonrushii]PWN33372.1 hypothetical protein FA14DRAFT_161261 [Meira miltonrushii]
MSGSFGPSPVASGSQKHETKNAIQGATKPIVYELIPPKWRPRLHPGSRAIGAPDIYIRRPKEPGPPEDEMSEVNVRNGLNARPAVGNETFSAHDMIYDRLKGKQVVNQLGSLFEEVAQRRKQLAGLRCGPTASQYRQPQRVTLNEVKLAAYVKDLADPSVPIGKLARSVPHGYRGERMLDMLWNGGSVSGAMAAMKSQPSIGSSSSNGVNASTPGGERNGLPNSVEISRAVWFIRVVGASEISSSRLRQGNSAFYTSEWTATMMGWLRRQIVELIITHHHSSVSDSPAAPPSPMPSRNRSSISTPQHNEEPYALILEDDFRDRWMAKWNYSVALLRALANEGLIDCQVAARFSIDMFRTANVAQIFITLALFQEFLDIIANSITLSHLALTVLTSKLKDLEEQVTSSSTFIQKEITAMLLYVFNTRPDSFVSPSCWQDLSRIINEARKSGASDCKLKSIAERNEKLLASFTNFTSADDEQSTDLARLQDLMILDRIPAHEDLQSTFELYFGRYCASISDRIRTLLVWATCDWRVGTHRPFAVATMLNMYIRYQPSRSQKRATHKSKDGKRMVLDRIDLDAIVMSWITDVDLAKKQNVGEEESEGNQKSLRWQNVLFSTSLHEMIILIGELYRLGCFSFPKYLQRLTARGLTAMGGREIRPDSEGTNGKHQEIPVADSLHSKLLRSVPLIACPAPLEHQRRVAIYGNRAKESWEEAMERRALRELSSALPWLSGSQDASEAQGKSEHFDLQRKLPRFWGSSRYIRSRIVQLHLLPSFREYVYGQEVLQDYQLSQFASLLIEAQEFAALQEVLEDISQHPQTYSETIIKVANSYAKQNRLVLLCMGSVFRTDYESGINAEKADPQQGEGNSAAKELGVPRDEDDLSTFSSSLRTFSEGRLPESMEMMKNHYASPRSLLSVANEYLSAGQEGNIKLISNWFRSLLLAYKGESQRWVQDLSNCLQDTSLSNNDVDILVNLSIVQISSQPSSFSDIVRNFCLPTLITYAGGSEANDTASLRAVVGILSSVFIPSDGLKRSWVVLDINFRSTDSHWTLSADILRMISALRKAENVNQQSSLLNDLEILRTSICRDENVRCLLQMNLKDSIDLVRSTVPAGDFHTVMRDLLPARWPWTSDDELITGMSRIFENADQWRWSQMLCENAITIEAIRSKTKEGSISSNKLNELARLFSERVLSSVDAACSSISITGLFGSLSSSNGAVFCIGLVDERLRVLNKQLEATFTDERLLQSELESLLRLWQKMAPMTISASALSAQAFRFVTEWLESNLPASPVQEVVSDQQNSDITTSEADLPNGELAVRLGILCFLMKLDNILMLPITKAFAPRLFCAIIQIALSLSRRPGMSERKVETLLDVARYLLQQAPLELQQTMRQRASEQIETGLLTHPSPLDRVTETIGRLVNIDADALGSNLTSNIGGKKISLIEAQSSSSAISDGQFAAVQIKPWDLHPNVEALVQGKSVATADAGQGSAHPIASFTEMNSLNNNGPISLQHFRAYRTLDRLPERSSLPLRKRTALDNSSLKVPFILPSEQNYGMNLAGQPIYARDAKRGLLVTSSNTAKMGLSAHDLQQLVPALCPPPKHDHEDTAIDKQGKDASNGAKKSNTANEKSPVKPSIAKGKADKKETANGKSTDSKTAGGNANSTARKRKTSNASVQDQKAAKATTTAASRKRTKK